jgi:hypothetical protein
MKMLKIYPNSMDTAATERIIARDTVVFILSCNQKGFSFLRGKVTFHANESTRRIERSELLKLCVCACV